VTTGNIAAAWTMLEPRFAAFTCRKCGQAKEVASCFVPYQAKLGDGHAVCRACLKDEQDRRKNTKGVAGDSWATPFWFSGNLR
jgi:transcription elongation factor Elf1